MVGARPGPLVRSRSPLAPVRVLSPGSDSPDSGPVCPPPVGGRLALFLSAWQEVTQDVFVLLFIFHGFQVPLLNFFPGVLREATVAPRDPKALQSVRSEIHALLSKRAFVQVKRLPALMSVSDFCYPRGYRGSSGHFESQADQFVYSRSAFPHGNFVCDSSTAHQPGLGGGYRPRGRLSSCSFSPSVSTPVGCCVPGADIPLQGSTVRSQGLSLSLHRVGGLGGRSPASSRRSHILLPERLVDCRGFPGPSRVPFALDSDCYSGSRLSD